MARVRWFGTTLAADPVQENPDGSWDMIARSHTARTVPGTRINVQKSEIVSMDPIAAPDVTASQAALEAAMAEERKTLTPVADLLARAPKTVVSVPPGPTHAPSLARQQPSSSMSSDRNDRLRAKLSSAAVVVKQLSDQIEARADSIIAQREKIAGHADRAFAPHEAALASHEAGLQEVEDALRLLDNGGPTG